MPHKTRKQKTKTDERRSFIRSFEKGEERSELVKNQITSEASVMSGKQPAGYTYEKLITATGKSEIRKEFTFSIANDLIKITIFALFAFGFQTVLYFLLRS